MLGFLSQRAVAGVEQVAGGSYRRTSPDGTVSVTFDPADASLVIDGATGSGTLDRVRHVFDPAGDTLPAAHAHLSADPALAPLLAARPGLRIPGGWDPFELAIRAVLGQQVTVAGARTLAGRLAACCAVPSNDPALPFLFPGPAAVAASDLLALGMPGARCRTLGAVAAAALAQPGLFRLPAAPDHRARLLAVPGIGPWSAEYILLRGFRDPDAFPFGDIGLLRAAAIDGVRPTPAVLLARAAGWRPFRAHAAQHLWAELSAQDDNRKRTSPVAR